MTGAPAACVCSQKLASSLNPPGSRCRPSRISGSLWIETGGLFAVWEGMPIWGRVCPFPLPAASYLWRGWAHPPQASSSLEFLSPFVLRTAGSVFRPVNFLSCYPAVYKSSLRLLSGPSGPVLTLSNAACSSPFHPHLLVADAGAWGTFLLGVAFRHVICGPYLIFPPS